MALAAAAPGASDAPPAARLKQSAARWCFSRIGLEDLCRAAANMGLAGIDLVDPPDWPVVRKYGLTPTIVTGAGAATSPAGWNRKENHARLEKEMRENIAQAAAAKIPNVITLSGTRRGLPDEEGRDNCILGLQRVKKFAEDAGVTICLELLNSKIDHRDYQCDHTAWGIAVVKAVDSLRVKLLYDIYHMQIMEGDIIRTIRQNIQYIGHIHTGGVPGRHELDDAQELQYRAIAKTVADLNYLGYVGHEFLPVRDPLASLRAAVELCAV